MSAKSTATQHTKVSGDFNHGTSTGYKEKCKCAECRAWKREDNRKQDERRKASGINCSQAGCDRPIECKDLCAAHYERMRLGTVPLDVPIKARHGRHSHFFKHGRYSVPPSLTKHLLYRTWKGMLRRCLSPNDPKFHHYGGRGITVCERWQNIEGQEPTGFVNFLADMGERPEGHSIDRIDVDGNYEPSNCRWADAKTQTYNRRPRKAA